MQIIGHIRHFQWLHPNVWWEISQIWIEYIKPIGQMSDEPWKFFRCTEKDVTPSLMHWSCVFLALTHRYAKTQSHGIQGPMIDCHQSSHPLMNWLIACLIGFNVVFNSKTHHPPRTQSLHLVEEDSGSAYDQSLPHGEFSLCWWCPTKKQGWFCVCAHPMRDNVTM